MGSYYCSEGVITYSERTGAQPEGHQAEEAAPREIQMDRRRQTMQIRGGTDCQER